MAKKLGACYSCIKTTIFIFNFIAWAFGICLIAIGVWLIVDSKRFVEAYNEYVSEGIRQAVGTFDEGIVAIGGITIIAVGSFIMIAGFLGCCGAMRESQIMLTIFFFILFAIFAALLSIGIVVMVKKDSGSVKDTLGKAMRLESGNTTNAARAKTFLAYANQWYGCCGVDDMAVCDKDYPPLEKVPLVCGKGMASCSKGCLNVVWGVMYNMAIGGAIIAFISAAGMIVGMVMSMCLCCAIRERDGRN